MRYHYHSPNHLWHPHSPFISTINEGALRSLLELAKAFTMPNGLLYGYDFSHHCVPYESFYRAKLPTVRRSRLVSIAARKIWTLWLLNGQLGQYPVLLWLTSLCSHRHYPLQPIWVEGLARVKTQVACWSWNCNPMSLLSFRHRTFWYYAIRNLS
jgi:hypothetical protein